MSTEFQYDAFLSHSAQDKQAVPVPKVVRPLAERLHPKAELGRKQAEAGFQPLAFSLQPR